jgi:hypothetical protein
MADPVNHDLFAAFITAERDFLALLQMRISDDMAILGQMPGNARAGGTAGRADAGTFVRVSESGWTGDADTLMRYVADSTQGFTLTLAGLKARLEHDLVAERYPKGIEEQVIGA